MKEKVHKGGYTILSQLLPNFYSSFTCRLLYLRIVPLILNTQPRKAKKKSQTGK